MRSVPLLSATALSTLTLCTLLTQPVAAVDAASRIQFVTGEVKVIHADGTESPAAKGDVIGPGDRVVTGDGGMVQIRAPEQGVLALRANSECRFDQQGQGLDVALTRGQLRTVTDLGGTGGGLIHVSTPDSRLAVGDGDVETGVQPGDAGDESFSQVHTGVIRLDGVRGGALTLQPGQIAKVDARGAALITDKPTFVQPILPLPTVSGGKPSTTLGPLVSNATPATGFSTPTTTPGIQTGVLATLDTQGLGGKSLAASDAPAVKLPDVRLEFASANVVGGSSAVNQGLSGQTFLIGGRLGSNDKVITPTTTVLDPSKVTGSVAFQPTTVTLGNGQTISAIKPTGGSTLVTTSGVSDTIVLLPAPTPTTVLSTTTLNTLNTSNTINPTITTTTPKINIGVLPKLR